MLRIIPNFDERALDSRYDLAVDLVVDGARHPPGRLLLDAQPDERPAVFHGIRGKPNRFVEQLLMPVVGCDHREHAAEEGRRLDGAHALLDATIDERLDI